MEDHLTGVPCYILVGGGSDLKVSMKKTNWAVAQFCLVVPCLLLYDLVLIYVDAEDAGTIFLDQKESNVKQIALSAELLDGNCSTFSHSFFLVSIAQVLMEIIRVRSSEKSGIIYSYRSKSFQSVSVPNSLNTSVSRL